jgi:hypothetical protein
MRFGITIKPDMTVERIVALVRQAEASGFEYGWIFDSHVLWLEPIPADADGDEHEEHAARHLRDESGDARHHGHVEPVCHLNLISGGRMQLGIGRGDSSRRVLGKKPVTVAQLEQAVKASAISPAARKRIRRVDRAPHMGDRRRSAGMGRGIRSEGARPRGPSRAME